SGDLQDLQRLLVLGPPVAGRPTPRPARPVPEGAPRLGPREAGTARELGRRQDVALPVPPAIAGAALAPPPAGDQPVVGVVWGAAENGSRSSPARGASSCSAPVSQRGR